MPVFEYKGFDKAGAAVAGVVDADTAKIARSRLRRQGVFPTDVREQSGEATRGSGLNMEIDVSQYLEFITSRDISVMTAQLSILLGAAVPMAEALTALVDQTEKGKLKVVLSKVKEQVIEGATLGDALEEHPHVFDVLFISMIKAGERSGALSEVLKRLAKFTEDRVRLQGQIMGALAYPALMATVGVLAIFGIFLGVVPQMRQMLEGLGGEDTLPMVTVLVFAIGDILVGYWWLFPLLGFGALFGFRSWVKRPEGREQFDRFKLRVWGFGRMNQLVAVSRFCRTLGTLLASGVPIITALSITRDVVGNVVLSDVIQQASLNIQEGQSISGPLKQSGEFPPMVIHMIAVGERTGELERMLNLIADSYESEVDAAIKGAVSLLGPLTIVVMGGVILVVALGLLLPIQNIAGAVI
ncbi:MAG: type II secretion system F family protein [Myxococcota bacterium]